jgi:hypothetical protein
VTKDLNGFVRQLRRGGFAVSRTGGSHWRITRPDLACPVFAASTPSDCRALRNVQATLRRAAQPHPRSTQP